MNRQDMRQRAIDAEELINSEAFKRTIQRIRDDAVKVFLKSDTVAEWEQSKHIANAAGRLVALLQSDIDNERFEADKERKARHRGNDRTD